MIVRELLTLLGFTVDQASYQKASKAYDQLQGKVTQSAQAAQKSAGALGQMGKQAQDAAKGTGMLGQALGMFQRFSAQAGISALLKEYTTLASDANETRSALGQLFGEEGAAQVDTWSQTMGAAMGRSSYDLQKYASGLGAVLGPVTESRAEAQKMAQSLSELAVDLGSFFNTTDEQAMHALRSGLTGEMESLKKYGIVINDAALKEVAEAKGIKKKITAMSQAEKTQLRYAAIIAASSAAQGDAARTSQGMANATKALKAQLKTLGIDAAKKVVPVIEKLVRFARDAVNWFSKMAKTSHILESAMYALAVVAAGLAAEFYAAFILPTLAIAALILLVDELWTTLDGGDTVLRDILNWVFGVEKTTKALAALKAEFGSLDAIGIWESFRDGAYNAGAAVEWLIGKLVRLVRYVPVVWALRKVGVLAPDDTPEQSFEEFMGQRQTNQRATIRAGVTNRAAEKAEAERAEKYGPSSYSAVPLPGQAATMGGEGYGVLRAPVPAAAGAGAGTAPVIVPVNTAAPTIIINGGDPAHIERVAKKVLADDRKANMAAVGGRGRS